MMLIASQVAAVVSVAVAGALLARACSPMPTQHTVVAVTPPGDDWRGLALAITLIPVTQLEQKRFQTRCRT